MSQQTFNYNVALADYQLLQGQVANTSLNQNGDTATLGQGYNGAEARKQVLVPHITYVENCLPTARGWQSLFPCIRVAPIESLPNFTQIIQLQCAQGNYVTLGINPSALPLVYILSNISGDVAWRTHTLPASVQESGFTEFFVTTATVRGITYFFVPYNGIFHYDAIAQEIVVDDMIGLDMTAIKGIVSSKNYLIAYTDDAYFWSSPENHLDFTPGVGQGGSTQVAEAKGKFVGAFTIQDGFVIYTSQNAVSATYNGNINFPFLLKEVVNSTGIVSAYHVAWETSTGQHFYMGSSGICVLTKTQAELIFPEVYDFVSRALRHEYYFDYSNYDIATRTFPVSYMLDKSLIPFENPDVRLSFIGSRYLAISYKHGQASPQDTFVSSEGDGEYNAAMVYDISLSRWGRLKALHQSISLFVPPSEVIAMAWEDFDNGETWETETLRWSDYTRTSQEAKLGDNAIAFYCASGKILRYESDLSQVVWGTDLPFLPMSQADLFKYMPKLIQGNIVYQKQRGTTIYTVRHFGDFADDNYYNAVGIILNQDSSTVPMICHDVPRTSVKPLVTEWLTRKSGQFPSIIHCGSFTLAGIEITLALGGSR